MDDNAPAPPNVFVVDAWMPTPDLDSASLRIVNLLSLLKEMSRSVTFGTDDPLSRTPPPGLLEGLGVEVLRPPATASIDAHLEREGDRYDLVILSRAHVASKYFRGARRHAPRAKVVFDTTDLAFLRGMRGAKVTGNLSLLKQALQARADELALAREADCTLVVSPVEKDVLEKECPGAPVRVVSLVQPAIGSARPFTEREGIVFVGAFPHHPNVDAMAYFCRDVHPLIGEDLPGVAVTVIGAYPPPWLRQRAAPDFVVTGQVPDVAPYLDRCRLTVAPLRYGAGVKGKVLLSMAHGVPVVASSIAVEGIPVADGRDALVADDPAGFAAAVAALYGDGALWERLSGNGLRLVGEHFSPAAARAALVGLFEMLGLRLATAIRE